MPGTIKPKDLEEQEKKRREALEMRMQKLPYLVKPRQQTDAKPAGPAQTPPVKNVTQAQKAQASGMPALFDAVSPMGKGLAKLMALSRQEPEEADKLFTFLRLAERDPDGPYYRPYARPTNQMAMDELNRLGVNASGIDRQWLEKNAWLKRYARTGSAGLLLPPKEDSSDAEKAGYYYTRLADAQDTTERAEQELAGLKREIGYWAGRKDRNYSDAEVLRRVGWDRYPTLSMLRADRQRGLPTPLNKAIDFDDDTAFGMLWSARNQKTSGSNAMDAARYALGEGRSFAPDPAVRALQDPGSPAYNPYALGSTVDDAARYFNVDTFDAAWLQKNRPILQTGNQTAIDMYGAVEAAERFTRQAESEWKDLQKAIDARLDLAAVSGKADAGALLRGVLANYPALRRMDEGRLAGNPAQLTRALPYRVEDIAARVQTKADILNQRMGSTKSSEALTAAAHNEKQAVIEVQGSALQMDAAPISLTAGRNLLWNGGLLAAIPPLVKDAGAARTEEEAAAFAARGIISAAAGRGIEAESGQAQAGMDRLADTLLGIRQDSLGKIASFFGAAAGKSASARPGTAGLVSLLLGTGAGVLSTITQNLLEGEEQPLSFLQTLSGLFKLRGAAAGEKTDADGLVSKALAGAVAKSLSGAQVHTGNAAFDGMATMAAQSGGSAETAQKRWGDAGVNYFANLVSAGRGDVAAILQTLPSYAKSVIVAEQNMRTFTLSPEKLYSQLRALQQDLYSPEVMQNALQRARLQAENASIGQKIAGGALAGLSVFQKEVDDAKAGYDQKQAELDSAKKAGQAAVQSHAAAHALFMKNLTDPSAVEGLIAAIDQLQATKEERKKAEQDVADSQRALFFTQQKFNTANQQIAGTLGAQVKKEIDERLAKVRDMLMQISGTPLNVSIGSDAVENDASSLASVNGNSIMKEDRRPLGDDAATGLPGMGDVPFRALASAGAMTDVRYANGVSAPWPQPGAPFYVTDEHGNIQYGPDGDVEIELIDSYPDVTPKPTPIPTPTPEPTPKPSPTPKPPAPVYAINLAVKGGYANNKSVYPNATEETLMPWEYLMQGQAVMVKEKYPYAADQMISGNPKDKRSECVGMIRLPGQSWLPGSKSKQLPTTVRGTYDNSTHKGAFTADMDKFNGMQLITKDYKHIATYYKEFFDGEKVWHDVIVHNAGKKYIKIKEGMTPEEIAAAKEKNMEVDRYNKERHAEIVPFEDALKKYPFQYWCAPDYIDYGDQKVPGTNKQLTPNKQWK